MLRWNAVAKLLVISTLNVKKMKKNFKNMIIAGLLFANCLYSQGILNNGAKIVINQNVHLVVDGDITQEEVGSSEGTITLSGILHISGDYANNNSNSNGLFLNGVANQLSFIGTGEQNIFSPAENEFNLQNVSISDGALLNIGSNKVTISETLELGGNDFCLNIGSIDFEVLGDITGNGLISVIHSGELVRTPAQNEETVFPIGNGTFNQTVSITPMNAPSEKIRIRINDDKNVDGTIVSNMDFWNIDFEENLNATLKLRIEKDAIAPAVIYNNIGIRYFDGSVYKQYPQENISVEEFSTYYIITITSVNQF